MPELSPTTVPLCFTIAFHEKCDESQKLAQELFRWFRMQHEDGDAIEAGLPVWYRCRVAGDEHSGHLVPPLADDADLNVIVVLVSDKLVNDPKWRAALEVDLVLSRGTGRRLVLPVAVDDSFYRLAFLYQDTQPLRIGPPRPTDAARKPKEEEDKRLTLRVGLLRRAVTEIVARALRDEGAGSPGALQVFISHAKRDGTAVAEQVRDRLAGHSQLRAWYDANELPPGFAWNHPMAHAAKENTAALVSVVSDVYATRYWCRLEVELARTPRPLGEGGRVWTVQPAVAVQIDGGIFRRPMAPLSQVVHVGWQGAEANGDAVAQVVDRLLLEVLLAEFYRRLCGKLAASDTDAGTVYLTFVPDPWTLTRLIGALRADNRPLPTRIAYPGFGLRSGELVELRRIARDLGYTTAETLFVTLEEAASPRGSGTKPSGGHGPVVVLSAGGTLDGMAAWGASIEHADDLLVRLSLRLLRRGWRLAYGGSLGDFTNNVTKSLLEVARVYGEEAALLTASAAPRATAGELLRPPLVNYAAWPNHRYIQERHKASQVGICQFEEVMPPGVQKSVLDEQLDRPKDPLTAFLGAEALTMMRKKSAEGALLRVVVGGKSRGWQGWLPGIAEEVEASLAMGSFEQPFVIIGGLGGCAGELARYLGSGTWPDELTFEKAMEKDAAFGLLIEHPGARRTAHERFVALKEALTAFRVHLHARGPDEPLFASNAGPTRREFEQLLVDSSATSCLNTIVTIADRLRAAPGVTRV